MGVHSFTVLVGRLHQKLVVRHLGLNKIFFRTKGINLGLYSVGFKPTNQGLRQGFELKGQGLVGVLQPMQAVSYGLPCVPPALSDFCGKKRDAFQCKKILQSMSKRKTKKFIVKEQEILNPEDKKLA